MCGETRVFHVGLSCHFFPRDMCVISFHVLSFPCASCASCHVQVFAILAIAAQSQVSTVLLNTLAVAPAVADF